MVSNQSISSVKDVQRSFWLLHPRLSDWFVVSWRLESIQPIFVAFNYIILFLRPWRIRPLQASHDSSVHRWRLDDHGWAKQQLNKISRVNMWIQMADDTIVQEQGALILSKLLGNWSEVRWWRIQETPCGPDRLIQQHGRPGPCPETDADWDTAR